MTIPRLFAVKTATFSTRENYIPSTGREQRSVFKTVAVNISLLILLLGWVGRCVRVK